MTIVAIIEVRMGSTRLFGKALIEVVGKPILEHIVNRIRLCDRIDRIVLATTINPFDDEIERFAKKIGVTCFRGSEEDVLLRVVQASQFVNADVVVLSGGDSPFFDWQITDQLIDKFFENPSVDLVTNCLELTYPLGVYAYVFPVKVLKYIALLAKTLAQREDTLRYIFENLNDFTVVNLKAPEDLHRPEFRLTVDYPEDVQLTKNVYENLYPVKPEFITRDVIEFLDEHPEIASLNKNCIQKSAPHIVGEEISKVSETFGIPSS